MSTSAASHDRHIREKLKLTPPELAAEWGIDPAKVVGWIKSGELRAINVASNVRGRPRYLIDRADIAAFETARTITKQLPTRRRRKQDPNIIKFY